MSDLTRMRAAPANKAHAACKRAAKNARERIPCLRCREPFPTDCPKRNRICETCKGDIDDVSPFEPDAAHELTARRRFSRDDWNGSTDNAHQGG